MSEWPETLIEKVAAGMYEAELPDETVKLSWAPAHPRDREFWMVMAAAALDALGLQEEWGTRYEAHADYDIEESADDEWTARGMVDESPTDTGLIRRYRTPWEDV